MSMQDDNKAIVGRWFTDFWGETCNLSVVDEIAAPDMLLKYSLHEPRKGREDIKAFMTDFRAAFPNLNFWGTADLIAEGDCVVGQWEGGGTHTGPAFKDFLVSVMIPHWTFFGYLTLATETFIGTTLILGLFTSPTRILFRQISFTAVILFRGESMTFIGAILHCLGSPI